MKPNDGIPMDPSIQDFSDCHVGIFQTLESLSTLSREQDAAPRRREVAGQVLRFFRDVVSVHHNEEEAELFPAVLEDATAGDERREVEALVHRLKDEHRHVERLYDQLAPALSSIESGGEATLDPSVVAMLVKGYLAHARAEEDAFLPLAQTILGRNSNHMAALGLALHIRHASSDVRRKFGFI